MSNRSDTRLFADIAPGEFVTALVSGRPTLCLKVERIGKEHVSHYLIPLDPLEDRSSLALICVDPAGETVPEGGIALVFDEIDEIGGPEPGDVFVCRFGTFLKVIDDPRAQRVHAYVDVETGLLRPRMERDVERRLTWRVRRG